MAKKKMNTQQIQDFLELVSNEDLTNEILRRHDAGVIVLRQSKSGDDGPARMKIRATANLEAALDILQAATQHTIKGLLNPAGGYFELDTGASDEHDRPNGEGSSGPATEGK